MRSASALYSAAMVVMGLALGLASLVWPVVSDGPVPPLMALIGLSLLCDLALMYGADRGRVDLLTMNGRLFGFFGGAFVYLGVRALLA